MRRSRLSTAALRIVGVLRDGWIILGLTALLVLAAEGLYRLQGTVRRDLFGSGGRPPSSSGAMPGAGGGAEHPNAGEAWWRGWWQVAIMKQARRYSPYTGYVWARSFHSRYINVDSAGHRVTPQTPARGSPRRVVLLGGSTMWGYTVRDSFTIPTLVAARLHARGIDDVDVENRAQPGYDITQDLITLMLELRSGRVPAAAVFLDGHNDVAAAWWDGHPGDVLEQQELTAIFERGGASWWATTAGALTDHLTLVRRLLRSRSGAWAPRQQLGHPPQCSDVAATYRWVTDEAEALGRRFGFATVFLWQPLLATTHKPLTPWERSIAPPPYLDYLVRCTAAADSAMGDRLGRTYFPLGALFDHDTASVFLDHVGHVTESADDSIAARITDIVTPLLRARR